MFIVYGLFVFEFPEKQKQNFESVIWRKSEKQNKTKKTHIQIIDVDFSPQLVKQ